MKKIIAVTALAAGFLAWRMGAMQEQKKGLAEISQKRSIGSVGKGQQGFGQINEPSTGIWRMGAMQQEAQEVIKLKDKNGVEFMLPKNQAMLSLTIRNIMNDMKDSSDPMPLGLATQDEVVGLLTSANYEFILNAHNQNSLAIQGISDQVREERARAKARELPARDYAYSKGGLQQAWSYFKVAHYLYIPELIEKYARIIAGMLCSDAAMTLLKENNAEHVAFVNEINEKSSYADPIMSYIPQVEWRVLHTLSGHINLLSSAEFSPDGSKIVTASYDSSAKIWDAQTGVFQKMLSAHRHGLILAEFSRDGSKILTAADAMAIIWNAQTGALEHMLAGHTNWVKSARFSPDGNKIVTASYDRTAIIWNTQTGALEHTLAGHTAELFKAEFSPDGSKIVTASEDKTAKIWNAQTGMLELTLAGHRNGLRSAEFSPDGSKILTASRDSTAKIWNAQTGVLYHTLKDDSRIKSARFSPNGSKIVTLSWLTTGKIWNAQTGLSEHTLVGHTGLLESAEFSRDGSKIVTASDDRTAIVWNAHTGALEHTLAGHTALLRSAEFSPDGSKIVTASGDQTAKIWGLSLADSMKQALFLRYLAFTKKQGGEPGWVSGWGRSVMDSYDDADKAFIEERYPREIKPETTTGSMGDAIRDAGRRIYEYWSSSSSSSNNSNNN